MACEARLLARHQINLAIRMIYDGKRPIRLLNDHDKLPGMIRIISGELSEKGTHAIRLDVHRVKFGR